MTKRYVWQPTTAEIADRFGAVFGAWLEEHAIEHLPVNVIREALVTLLDDVDLSDVNFIQSFLFNGGDDPACLDACDANDDGVFNNADIASFVLALTNQKAYQAMFPDVNPDVLLDMNGDGVLDLEDVEEMGYEAVTGEELVHFYQHHQLHCGYNYDFDGDSDPGGCVLGARAGGITGVPR